MGSTQPEMWPHFKGGGGGGGLALLTVIEVDVTAASKRLPREQSFLWTHIVKAKERLITDRDGF